MERSSSPRSSATVRRAVGDLLLLLDLRCRSRCRSPCCASCWLARASDRPIVVLLDEDDIVDPTHRGRSGRLLLQGSTRREFRSAPGPTCQRFGDATANAGCPRFRPVGSRICGSRCWRPISWSRSWRDGPSAENGEAGAAAAGELGGAAAQALSMTTFIAREGVRSEPSLDPTPDPSPDG